jgi:hypothetical protein
VDFRSGREELAPALFWTKVRGNVKRKRNSDGTFRRADAPRTQTNRSVIARWVEDEVAARRNDQGTSFFKIAKVLAAAARGEVAARVALPRGVQFPADYHISERGARKAYDRQRAPGRSSTTSERRNSEPSLDKQAYSNTLDPMTPKQMLALTNERLEDLFLSTQLGVHQGRMGAVRRALQILDLLAKINGYSAGQAVAHENTLYLEKLTKEHERDLKIWRAMTPAEYEIVDPIRKRVEQRIEEAEKATSKKAPSKENPPTKERAQSKKKPTSDRPVVAMNSEAPKHAPATSSGSKVTPSESTTTYEEFSAVRDLVLELLRKNHPAIFTTNQIATDLHVDQSLARNALNSRSEEGLIAYLGSEHWQFKMQNGET